MANTFPTTDLRARSGALDPEIQPEGGAKPVRHRHRSHSATAGALSGLAIGSATLVGSSALVIALSALR